MLTYEQAIARADEMLQRAGQQAHTVDRMRVVADGYTMLAGEIRQGDLARIRDHGERPDTGGEPGGRAEDGHSFARPVPD